MAGGGEKAGTSYGEADDCSYNIVENPMHIRDLNATILNLLGMDHDRLSFKFKWLDQKVTGAEAARVVKELLA